MNNFEKSLLKIIDSDQGNGEIILQNLGNKEIDISHNSLFLRIKLKPKIKFTLLAISIFAIVLCIFIVIVDQGTREGWIILAGGFFMLVFVYLKVFRNTKNNNCLYLSPERVTLALPGSKVLINWKDFSFEIKDQSIYLKEKGEIKFSLNSEDFPFTLETIEKVFEYYQSNPQELNINEYSDIEKIDRLQLVGGYNIFDDYKYYICQYNPFAGRSIAGWGWAILLLLFGSFMGFGVLHGVIFSELLNEESDLTGLELLGFSLFGLFWLAIGYIGVAHIRRAIYLTKHPRQIKLYPSEIEIPTNIYSEDTICFPYQSIEQISYIEESPNITWSRINLLFRGKNYVIETDLISETAYKYLKYILADKTPHLNKTEFHNY